MLDRVLSVVLTVSTVALVTLFAKRELETGGSEEGRAPKYHDEWTRVLSLGHRSGQQGAPVVLVEFGDFECPFCRELEASLEVVRQRHEERLATVFVHFPLMNVHRFAMPAAEAAECAGQQGRFWEFHDLVFEKQDSMGLKSWLSYAREAGVQDDSAYAECSSGGAVRRRIEEGLELGREIGVSGTPTVMVNGWLYPPGALTVEELEKAIAIALEDRRRGTSSRGVERTGG